MKRTTFHPVVSSVRDVPAVLSDNLARGCAITLGDLYDDLYAVVEGTRALSDKHKGLLQVALGVWYISRLQDLSDKCRQDFNDIRRVVKRY